MNKLSSLAPYILRLGIGFVFVWFGYMGITNPSMFIKLVPTWTAILGTPEKLVLFHGIFELVFGVMLALGFYIRFTSAILLLNLIHTITLLGWGPNAVRDIGISASLLSIFLSGKRF